MHGLLHPLNRMPLAIPERIARYRTLLCLGLCETIRRIGVMVLANLGNTGEGLNIPVPFSNGQEGIYKSARSLRTQRVFLPLLCRYPSCLGRQNIRRDLLD